MLNSGGTFCILRGMFRKQTVCFCICIVLAGIATAAEQNAKPRFPDLAVLLAKGWFRQYVAPEAPLHECVTFLNRQGIWFSLFDLMDPNAVVTREDFARVTGQATLLLRGEAELEDGCIKNPLKNESWVDYCVLNDVELSMLWNGFLKRVTH
jgi:hypothetical protein